MNTTVAPGATVLVVGGGIAGTSAAYALANAGYAVTLVTAEQVGEGATAGNAGLLVPADSVVWPGPANARAVPATLLGRGGSSIKVSWANPATVPWGIRFLAHSTPRKYATSCRASHALSAYSLAVAEAWARELSADLHRTGMLFLVDSAEAATELRHARRALQDEGETYVELSRAELVAMDEAYDTLPDGIRAVYAPGAATRRQSGVSLCSGRPVTCRRSDRPGRAPVTRLLLDSGRVDGGGVGSWPASMPTRSSSPQVSEHETWRAPPEFGHRYFPSRATRPPCLSRPAAGLPRSEECWRAGMWRSPAWGTESLVDGRRDRSHRPLRDRADEATAETSW